MRRRRRGGHPEQGAAVIEFIAVIVLLMVPLTYGIVVMADVQRALLAVSSAAREGARVYVNAAFDAPDGEDPRTFAEATAEQAVDEIMANHAFQAGEDELAIETECPPDAPAACQGGFGPGAEVTVTVTYDVPVIQLPVFGPVAGFPVRAIHHTRMDRYRGLTG